MRHNLADDAGPTPFAETRFRRSRNARQNRTGSWRKAAATRRGAGAGSQADPWARSIACGRGDKKNGACAPGGGSRMTNGGLSKFFICPAGRVRPRPDHPVVGARSPAGYAARVGPSTYAGPRWCRSAICWGHCPPPTALESLLLRLWEGDARRDPSGIPYSPTSSGAGMGWRRGCILPIWRSTQRMAAAESNPPALPLAKKRNGKSGIQR